MTHGGRKKLPAPDILILGAGLIGLSIALELEQRGYTVTVLDPRGPLTAASFAAAGMLAAEDPHNPPEILSLSRRSISLYPAWLARLQEQSGLPVPLQTSRTWQYHADGTRTLLEENSLDPRMLAAAVLAAVRARSRIRLLSDGVAPAHAGTVIHASGAWQPELLPLREGAAVPRKGQMLRIAIPAEARIEEVHRSETVYVVPRTAGPQAGSAVIGATVEDAGFDQTVHPADLAWLRQAASRMVPEVGSVDEAPLLESWAGLRPSSGDGLPILGAVPRCACTWIAAGHYRNGILLAPVTAEAIADLVENKVTVTPLHAFDPARFVD